MVLPSDLDRHKALETESSAPVQLRLGSNWICRSSGALDSASKLAEVGGICCDLHTHSSSEFEGFETLASQHSSRALWKQFMTRGMKGTVGLQNSD